MMLKKFVLGVFCLALSTVLMAQDQVLSVQEAINQKYIKAVVKGADSMSSRKTGNIMVLYADNVRPDTVYFRIDPGLKVMSNDRRMTTLVTGKTHYVKIAPKASIRDTFFVFNLQKTRQLGPTVATLYRFESLPADEKGDLLRETIDFIDKNEFYGNAGQEAIYCLTYDEKSRMPKPSVANIYGRNTQKVNKLRLFISRATALKYIDYYDQRVFYDFTTGPADKTSFYGELQYNVKKPAIVEVFLYDVDGEFVDTIKKLQVTEVGGYTYSFRLSEIDLVGGLAYVRLYVSGTLEMEMVFDRYGTLLREEEAMKAKEEQAEEYDPEDDW